MPYNDFYHCIKQDSIMEWFSKTLTYKTSGKGLYIITDDISTVVNLWNIHTGMCFLFLPHTSASLTFCENYDPLSQKDVKYFYEQLVSEGEPWQQHTIEGADDSPSHIRTTLTQSSISIPIDNGKLSLGIWQGIFLFEHRKIPQRRALFVRGLKIE
ncbi:MAG: YjbQ family protein [Anaerolineaceae bacterium]|nr:YjbQ family protein [Anaerolineaceae bacterium]